MLHEVDGRVGSYFGQLDASGEKPEGRGVIFWKDGSFFEGRWHDGEIEHGRMLSAD